MRKLIVSQFVTLDGVIEDPGGSEGSERGGWAFRFDRGPEGDAFKLEEVLGADALLLGRRTYEGFAEAWPARELFESGGVEVGYHESDAAHQIDPHHAAAARSWLRETLALD